ncbi:MAG: hypothetical protein ACYCSF_09610 [Acidimicrobiales bacterium]
MTVRFLSAEWFAALGEQLAGVTLPSGDESGPFFIGQLVTGAPDGRDHAWTLVLQGGSPPGLEVGSDSAEVVLVESYESAWALASGEKTAGQLLEAGEIKIRGDARRLVAAAELLEIASGACGTLSEITTRD